MESSLLDSLEYSVVQGSKLSSLLYILYTNEIPLLHKLINNELYYKLTGDNSTNIYNNIANYVIQYVDDSSNLISSDNIEEISKYIDQYFKVLEGFYNLNKLMLNPDKTKFMIFCKANLRNNTSNIKLNTTQ